MEEQNVDIIEQVHAAKRRRTVIGIALAAAVILLLAAIFGKGKNGEKEIDLEVALSRAPALALTEEELALAGTILEFDGFRDALTYDLAENTTGFTWEETEAVVGPVIPEGAEILNIAVSGAVVCVEYRLPQYKITLQYVDADRSGSIDSIRKLLSPIIDGTVTSVYALDHSLATGKTTCTYTML